jgi:glycosyltransferase involved in cell wall biosynthesis
MPDVESRANAGSKHEPIRLVMVARLDDQKDHRTLFAAIESLREKPWELVLVGDGPLEGELKQMAAASGISDRVRFLGLRNDVEAILAEGQIFLLISNWEGFPRSIIEAMRAGLPVIASDVGGVAEAVQDGTTGYVIAPKDAAALESRLRSLLDEPAERVRMGSQARSSYEARYRFERMANENLAVYRSILPE